MTAKIAQQLGYVPGAIVVGRHVKLEFEILGYPQDFYRHIGVRAIGIGSEFTLRIYDKSTGWLVSLKTEAPESPVNNK